MGPILGRRMLGWCVLAAMFCGTAAADEPTRIADDPGSVQRAHLISTLETQRHGTLEPTDRRVDDSRTSPSSARSRLGEQSAVVTSDGPRLPPPRAGRQMQPTTAFGARSTRWIAKRTGLVLAVFFALVLVQRRWFSGPRHASFNGLVKVCDKVALDSKRTLLLVQIGQRLLILLESPQGTQCAAEITDPAEVRRFLEGETTAQDAPAIDVQQVLSTLRQREGSLA